MLQVELTEELIAQNNYPGDCKRCLFARALSLLGYQEVWVDETWASFKVDNTLKRINLSKEAINLIDLHDTGAKINPQTIVVTYENI